MRHQFITAFAFAALTAFVGQQAAAQAPAAQGQGGQGQTGQGQTGQGGQGQGGQQGGQGQGGTQKGQGQAGQTGQGQSSSADRTAMTTGNLSVTGCLQKGTGKDAYTITSTDGKQYQVKTNNSAVKLDDHVNHRVTIMGTQGSGDSTTSNQTSQGTTGQSSTKTGQTTTGTQSSSTTSQNAGGGQAGTMLDASSLTMVSTSCQ